QIAADFGCGAHCLHQTVIETLGRIDTAVLEQMVHRDHFGDDGDVLPRIEGDGDLRQGNVQDRGALAIQPGAVDHELRIPVHELDDDLDALLLPNGANTEDGWHVDEPDAADLHVVALELVSASEEHFRAAARDHHDVVGNEAMAALDEIEHALRLTYSTSPNEQQPDA